MMTYSQNDNFKKQRGKYSCLGSPNVEQFAWKHTRFWHVACYVAIDIMYFSFRETTLQFVSHFQAHQMS